MAFNAANLSIKRRFAEGNLGWAYSTSDDTSTVGNGSYFDGSSEAVERLRSGDLIAATVSDGKVLLIVESTNVGAGVESISYQKLASGVTSFEYLA